MYYYNYHELAEGARLHGNVNVYVLFAARASTKFSATDAGLSNIVLLSSFWKKSVSRMVDSRSAEPPSSQDVYQALCGAASQDPASVRESTKLLQEYQARPGTYNHLYAIAADRDAVPLDVRRMAIIQFKNGALGVWKNRRQAQSMFVICR